MSFSACCSSHELTQFFQFLNTINIFHFFFIIPIPSSIFLVFWGNVSWLFVLTYGASIENAIQTRTVKYDFLQSHTSLQIWHFSFGLVAPHDAGYFHHKQSILFSLCWLHQLCIDLCTFVVTINFLWLFSSCLVLLSTFAAYFYCIWYKIWFQHKPKSSFASLTWRHGSRINTNRFSSGCDGK